MRWSGLDDLDVHLLFCFAVFVSYQKKNLFLQFGFVKHVLGFCSIRDYFSLIFVVRGMYFLWVIIFRLLDLGARYVHFLFDREGYSGLCVWILFYISFCF